MTTMTINTRDYNSTDNAIAEVLYEMFNQRDWKVIEYVKNVTYASTVENLKFNFWTFNHTVILEVTSIDFGFGSVQFRNKNLSLTQEPYIDSDFSFGYDRVVYRAAAVDNQGDHYFVNWKPVDGYHEMDDASDHCDWADPSEITMYEKGPYEKCKCGSLCIGDSFHVENKTYCQDCIERRVNQAVKEKNLTDIVTYLTANAVMSLGINHAYLAAKTEYSFGFCHFDLRDAADLNPRIEDDNLLIDLWFRWDLTASEGILNERIIDGNLQVKKIVVIEQIDYVTTKRKRYYW